MTAPTSRHAEQRMAWHRLWKLLLAQPSTIETAAKAIEVATRRRERVSVGLQVAQGEQTESHNYSRGRRDGHPHQH
jgi:hypothetical protein